MEQDKLCHLFAGAAIAAILYPFGNIVAMTGVTMAAFGKEWWDSKGNGTPDIKDVVATLVGGVGMVAWYWFVL